MNSFFNQGDYKNICNIGLPALYHANKGHFDALADVAMLRSQKSGGFTPRAHRLLPFLTADLIVDKIYRRHMKNARPWLPLMAASDIYTENFAKYILIKRFATHSSFP